MKQCSNQIIEDKTFDEYIKKFGKKFYQKKLKFYSLNDYDKLDKTKNYWKINDHNHSGYYEIKKSKILKPLIIFMVSSATIASVVVPCALIKVNKDFITINNGRNLEVTFCNYGASVFSVKYKSRFITYHPKNRDKFLISQKYFGKTLGRVAGRIKDGKITVDGVDYSLEKNDNDNTLHSGTGNLSFVNFERSVEEDNDSIDVIFKYISPDFECGFPGEVNFSITYSVNKLNDSFTILYNVSTKKVTPINMSTHIYWRLLGDDILNHTLTINADEKVKFGDSNLLIVGREEVDENFDFRNGQKIGAHIYDVAKSFPVANGYDHGFIFNVNKDSHVTLVNDDIKLDVDTDMDMVNIYTNCYYTKNLEINGYGFDKLYGGIAIEPETYFTGDDVTNLLVQPNTSYSRYITFTVGDVNNE